MTVLVCLETIKLADIRLRWLQKNSDSVMGILLRRNIGTESLSYFWVIDWWISLPYIHLTHLCQISGYTSLPHGFATCQRQITLSLQPLTLVLKKVLRPLLHSVFGFADFLHSIPESFVPLQHFRWLNVPCPVHTYFFGIGETRMDFVRFSSLPVCLPIFSPSPSDINYSPFTPHPSCDWASGPRVNTSYMLVGSFFIGVFVPNFGWFLHLLHRFR